MDLERAGETLVDLEVPAPDAVDDLDRLRRDRTAAVDDVGEDPLLGRGEEDEDADRVPDLVQRAIRTQQDRVRGAVVAEREVLGQGREVVEEGGGFDVDGDVEGERLGRHAPAPQAERPDVQFFSDAPGREREQRRRRRAHRIADDDVHDVLDAGHEHAALRHEHDTHLAGCDDGRLGDRLLLVRVVDDADVDLDHRVALFEGRTHEVVGQRDGEAVQALSVGRSLQRRELGERDVEGRGLEHDRPAGDRLAEEVLRGDRPGDRVARGVVNPCRGSPRYRSPAACSARP